MEECGGIVWDITIRKTAYFPNIKNDQTERGAKSGTGRNRQRRY